MSSLGSSDFDQQNADDPSKNISAENDTKRYAKQKTITNEDELQKGFNT